MLAGLKMNSSVDMAANLLSCKTDMVKVENSTADAAAVAELMHNPIAAIALMSALKSRNSAARVTKNTKSWQGWWHVSAE